MRRELTIVEPIPLPDVQRAAKLSSLPQWVQERVRSLREERQPDRAGTYRTIATLPATMLLDHQQKVALASHAERLDDVLKLRPDESDECAQKTLVAVSKMLMTLAGREGGGLAGEARGEAYMVALEDVPYWAVEEAIRHWYRGECGEHDYRWPPDPAMLRGLSALEVGRVRGVARALRKIVDAEALIEFSDEHRTSMRAKLASIGIR